MKPATLIFGTGPLGLSVMDALLAAGDKNITLVNRSGRAPENLPPGVILTPGDATDPQAVARLTDGIDVVFHCAQPGYTEWVDKFPPITDGILAGVAQSGARLVFGDNLYMYGDTGGAPVHEGLPYAAHTRKGRVRATMARKLLDAHAQGRVQVVIGRGSDFFGPRVLGSSMGEMVFENALQGKKAQVMGALDVPHSHTYISDFGRGLVLLSEHPEAYGQAWHIPNDRPEITQRELVTLIYDELGTEPRFSVLTKFMTALAAPFLPIAREGLEMMYEFEQPFVVSGEKMRAAFGFAPTPIREAVRASVAWFRENAGEPVK